MMLRPNISKSAFSAKQYFRNELTRGDYYAGNTVAGHWHGKAASLLGLDKNLAKEEFYDLVSNKHPVTKKRITKYNRKDRRCGFDFTFNAPKSLSLVHEYANATDPKLAKELREVWDRSVHETMSEIEQNVQARVRKNGAAREDRTTGNFIYAAFNHYSTRPTQKTGLPDPHLHTHAFILNLTFDHDEKVWKAIEFYDVMSGNRPYFERAFHARLARRLTKMGYTIRKKGRYWDIAGMDTETLKKFSNRTEEIEDYARAMGIVDDKDKDKLGFFTRKAKLKNMDEESLRKEWMDRLTPEEKKAIKNARNTCPDLEYSASCSRSSTGTRSQTTKTQKAPKTNAGNVTKAVNFALDHVFERKSTISLLKLQETALIAGFGLITPEAVESEIRSRSDVIIRKLNGRAMVTTKSVLGEEKDNIRFVKRGMGTCQSLNSSYDAAVPVYNFETQTPITLNVKQQKAVNHILHSCNRVIAVQGKAGTGKTTTLASVFKALDERGINAVAFAPSSDAARGVLRNDGIAYRSEAMKSAQTVAMLLSSEDVQSKITNGVIVIDEAGLVSSKDLHRVFAVAKAHNARVILVGDTAQHTSVGAGDAFRILQDHAGLKPALLNDIVRQDGAYRDAVAKLSVGKIRHGFNRLMNLGFIKEIKNEGKRHRKLVSAYTKSVRRGRKALVVSPTHIEADKVTKRIRQSMRENGMLTGRTMAYRSYKNLQWTKAQRRRAGTYEVGQIVRFHKKSWGVDRGTSFRITRIDSNSVWIGDKKLPLQQADRFNVYEERKIDLQAGDKVRVTENSMTIDNKHRLSNGAIYTVKGLTFEGNIILDNGWMVGKNSGNLTYGYVATSHASQGKTVDDVYISQSSESFPASSAEQFYVSVSRGKNKVKIFTDSKSELLEHVRRSGARMSAVELIQGRPPPAQKDGTLTSVFKDVWNTISAIHSSIKGSLKRQFNGTRPNYDYDKKTRYTRYNGPRMEAA